MGLFQKQQPKKQTLASEAREMAAIVFDDQFREDMRKHGLAYFDKVMSDSAAHFKKDLDTTIAQTNKDLKAYMTKRLDATIAHVNTEVSKQLDKRLAEYDRITKDAQDMAVQSLNRSAHTLHDKHQQLTQTLQKNIAEHEKAMATLLKEGTARLEDVKDAQDVAVRSLSDSARASQEKTERINEALQKTVSDQEVLLTGVVKESMARIEATKEAQAVALKTLDDSTQALKEQHQQLSTMLEKTIVDQKAMMVDTFQDNMSQIIEHYLLGALGDQFDMKAQLPLIIQQMEDNKQAIVDDMKL